MKADTLRRAIGGISGELIEAADRTPIAASPKTFPVRRAAAAAAAACVLIAVLIIPGLFRKYGPAAVPDSENPDSDISGIGSRPEEDLPADDRFLLIDEALRKEDGIGGGWFLFSREYQDITYDIAYLEHLYHGEIEAVDPDALNDWVSNVFLKKSTEEQNALPTMYQAVRDLGITKEKLIEVNESRKALGTEMILTDEYIDALYLEESEMKKQLIHPLALLYEGTIYTWETIRKIGPDQFDGAVLEQYLEHVREYCVSHHLIDASVFEDLMDS